MKSFNLSGIHLKKDSYIYCSSGAIYINTTEFKGDSNVYLKFNVTNGYFEEYFIYYGGSSSLPSYPYSVNLESTKDSYYDTWVLKKNAYYSPYSGLMDTKDEAAYFKIPIPEEKFLFISVPNYESLGSSVLITFDSTLTVAEIVGICIGAIIAFGLILFLILWYCCYKRKQRHANNFQSTNNTPATPATLI